MSTRLALGMAASLAGLAALSRRGGSRSAGGRTERWFHGTATAALPDVLREGLRGRVASAQPEPTPAELAQTVRDKHREVWTQHGGKAYPRRGVDPWYNDFHEEVADWWWMGPDGDPRLNVGTPLEGYAYLASFRGSALTRPTRGCMDGARVVLEVEVNPSDLVVDEDHLGGLIGEIVTGVQDPKSSPEEARLLARMGPAFRRDIEDLAKLVPVSFEEWRTGSPIAKTIYRQLGPKVYASVPIDGYESAATRVMPKIVAVWLNGQRLSRDETLDLVRRIERECESTASHRREDLGPPLTKPWEGPVFQWKPGSAADGHRGARL